MDLTRFVGLVAGLLMFSLAQASQTSLPVQVADQIYTLELVPHSPGGIVDTEAGHFKGSVSGIEDSWARISRIGDQWEGVISLDGELHLINTSSPGPAARALTSMVTQTTPASAYSDLGACAAHDHHHGHHLQTENSDTPIARAMTLNTPIAQGADFNTVCASTVDGVCLMVEIDFVFDQAFQEDFPDDYRSRAVQLINITEGYYRNDMDIGFKTLTTTFLSSSVFSNTTNSALLLEDMAAKKRDGELNFSSGDEVLMHLVTGRDFDGGTVGIAWVPGICDSSGYYSTGTTQVVARNIAITALVAAHELGHNLGSFHDGHRDDLQPANNNNCDAESFIMSSSVNATASRFSSCSVSYMQDTIGSIANKNACFDYPYDIGIAANNSGNSLVASSVTRQFVINAADASVSINNASVTGNINNGSGTLTAVSIDNNACSVAGDGQSYSCTINNPGNNHLLSATLSVETGNYSVVHQVSVSQSQLSETDSSNNSVTDSFSVLLGGDGDLIIDDAGGNVADNSQPPPDNEDSGDSGNSETDSGSAEGSNTSNASEESSSGGGGGSSGFFLLIFLGLLSVFRRKIRLSAL